MVLPPYSFNYLSIFAMKSSRPLNHIIIKSPLKVFSIWKHEFSFSFFEVFYKIT